VSVTGLVRSAGAAGHAQTYTCDEYSTCLAVAWREAQVRLGSAEAAAAASRLAEARARDEAEALLQKVMPAQRSQEAMAVTPYTLYPDPTPYTPANSNTRGDRNWQLHPNWQLRPKPEPEPLSRVKQEERGTGTYSLHPTPEPLSQVMHMDSQQEAHGVAVKQVQQRLALEEEARAALEAQLQQAQVSWLWVGVCM